MESWLVHTINFVIHVLLLAFSIVFYIYKANIYTKKLNTKASSAEVELRD